MLPSECVMPGTTPETSDWIPHPTPRLMENFTAMAHIWHNMALSGPLPPSCFQHGHSISQPTHSLLFNDYFPPREQLSPRRLHAVKKTAPIWLASLCQILDIRIRNSRDLRQARSLGQKTASFTLAESTKHQLIRPVQGPKVAGIIYSSTAMDFM